MRGHLVAIDKNRRAKFDTRLGQRARGRLEAHALITLAAIYHPHLALPSFHTVVSSFRCLRAYSGNDGENNAKVRRACICGCQWQAGSFVVRIRSAHVFASRPAHFRAHTTYRQSTGAMGLAGSLRDCAQSRSREVLRGA